MGLGIRDYVVPLGFAAWLVVALLWSSVNELPGTVTAEPTRVPTIDATAPISPIVVESDLDARKVALGKRLFEEKSFSKDGTVACASCHGLDTAGADRTAVSTGVENRLGKRNALTVFNAAHNSMQFWDGRAATLERQMDGPMTGAAEMASDWEKTVATLRAGGDYAHDFAKIYPDGVTTTNIRDAIATYERSLQTPDAPFDRFLRGDVTAITADELHGYELFISYGCASCHQGTNVGGNMYQKFGLVTDASEAALVSPDDLGRYEITKDDGDRFVFRVPSLRNVASTPPYFHNGSAPTLASAITVMGRVQLGRELSDNDVRSIAAFLTTLTGQYGGRSL